MNTTNPTQSGDGDPAGSERLLLRYRDPTEIAIERCIVIKSITHGARLRKRAALINAAP